MDVVQYVENTNGNSNKDWRLTTITLPGKFADCSAILTIQGSSGDIVKQIDLGLVRDILTVRIQGGSFQNESPSEGKERLE